jgi:hypothetical protein
MSAQRPDEEACDQTGNNFYAKSVSSLRARIADYKHFLPDWPALHQSFQRDLDALLLKSDRNT